MVATGERAGQRVRRVLSDPAQGIRSAPLCFAARGFSVHAATTVQAHDRDGLERLCRYVNRPPLAYGRLQHLDAERLSFTLKTPWDDGTYRIVVSPHELIEKLAALVPPPRLHLIRYYGVLAPHAADRDLIVPSANTTDGAASATTHTPPLSPVQRLKWAQLLARMFAVDITVCPRCGGTMRLVAALTDPHSIRTYLTGVGLPADPPTISPARPPPQQELD
jgi:putative transposase